MAIMQLKNVRLAFPALFEPKAVNPGDKPKFGGSFLLPPDHPQVAEIRQNIIQTARDKWGEKADAILKELKAKDRLCLHDGDTKAQYDGFEGMLYVSASSDARPTLIDRDKTPLVEADGRPYAGCYVVVSIDIWAQDNNYGKRINATLRGVQFSKDGDAFSGARPADADEFDDLGGDESSEAIDDMEALA